MIHHTKLNIGVAYCKRSNRIVILPEWPRVYHDGSDDINTERCDVMQVEVPITFDDTNGRALMNTPNKEDFAIKVDLPIW